MTTNVFPLNYPNFLKYISTSFFKNYTRFFFFFKELKWLINKVATDLKFLSLGVFNLIGMCTWSQRLIKDLFTLYIRWT